MLYYLFDYLDKVWDLSGAGAFRFITFRASLAAALALLISLFIGKRIINWLVRKQIGESIRESGPATHQSKKGTPTMGGIILLIAMIIPTLLSARLDNIYVLVMVVATLWMGVIGGTDDYIKVFLKDKKGLRSRSKVIGQVGLGLLIATLLFYHK
ncbi:MAG: phospho-N-acetylmuramoyl-pentapeptide-transferase, partial [Bacteroidota bacterium]